MRYKNYIIILFLFVSGNIYAQVKLPAIFSSEMVLQQQSEAPLWGWAKPGEKIYIQGSWSNIVLQTTADNNGEWKLKLPTPEAGGPYFVSINSDTLHNVMIGEVWICSGQSNMKFSLEQLKAEDEISSADLPYVRLFYVARDNSDVPNYDCYGKWAECTPESAKSFSAVAYYFGKELYNELEIPIGLIHTSWGGSTAQAWINYNALEATMEGQYYINQYKEKVNNSLPGILPRDHRSPAGLYNAMLHPIIPFGIRGVIWYQGESNTKEHYQYRNLMETLVLNWREEWRQGDFPFYYVQLAPYGYELPIIGAALRDAQRKALDIPNTGMAVTLDIGDPDNIHPINKQDVGKRLAAWALNRDYNKDIEFSGPLYRKYEVEKSGIRIFFDHVINGLIDGAEGLSNFEIAGEDKIFYPAKASIEGNSVFVSVPDVADPVAVRYAFHNADKATLFNKEGLPASSFRTDDWEIFVENVGLQCDYLKMEDLFLITLKAGYRTTHIRFSTDGSDSSLNTEIYDKPFKIKGPGIIRARAYLNDIPSEVLKTGEIIRHIAVGKIVTYMEKWNQSYTGGGDLALVNGIKGGDHFSDDNWQGFRGKDVDVVIDLEEEKTINKISAGFLQDQNSWILFPDKVEYYGSTNGDTFHKMGEVINETPKDENGSIKRDFTLNNLTVTYRYIKVRAAKLILPTWHSGAGNDAWMFTDEIIVE